MTPQARLAAAAEILDQIAEGAASEQALTRWARSNRYAGSKDRAAVRDIVFDIVRRWRSCAALGGGETGRARVLGYLRGQGEDPDAWFNGLGYGLAPLSAVEHAAGAAPKANAARDIPDWLAPELEASLGAGFEPVCLAMQQRATIFVRCHQGRTTRDAAIAALAADGITATPVALAETALAIEDGARRVRHSQAYLDGRVELQDAASQAVCAALPVMPGTQALDYCAGGGGKALALAARGAEVSAHDGKPERMADLPARAARAQTPVALVQGPALAGASFDLVVADVPCSGSGAWRRQPDAKWRLTAARLAELCDIQQSILRAAATHVRPGGSLAYVTCSILERENAAQVAAFLATAGQDWTVTQTRSFSPLEGCDGFFLALLRRTDQP